MEIAKREMWNIFVSCFIFLTATRLDTANASSAADEYYTAGVVEFQPVLFGLNSTETLANHLAAYLEIINSTEANETDIIVFPEETLNSDFTLTVVPSVEAQVIPCIDAPEEYAPFLVQLSCAARDAHKYIVVNLKEHELCATSTNSRPCAADGWRKYNTNVVFDRSGRVVSRYRKWHIFRDSNVEQTDEPEYAIFETDFGVRFGHFICFDILFYTPSMELVTRHGVRDIIFTSMWYSELPFLTATQIQQSWAFGLDVNLLAAGASFPVNGITGSGIYAGTSGALVRKMTGGKGVRELLVARVPKSKSTRVDPAEKVATPPAVTTAADDADEDVKHQNGIRMLKDPDLENFTSHLLIFTQSRQQHHLCQQELCCDFDIETELVGRVNETVPHYTYRIGVFNGRRSYLQAGEYSDIRLCAIYTCTNQSVASCGEGFYSAQAPKRYVNFKSIDISGNFAREEPLILMPNTLDTEMYSLAAEDFSWNRAEQGGNYVPHIRLLKPQTDLMTFGIYASYYKSAATLGQLNVQLCVLLLIVSLLGVFRY